MPAANIVDLVVKYISSCAASLKISPEQVEYNDFQLYYKKANGVGLSNAQAKEIKAAGGFRNIKDAHFAPKTSYPAFEIKETAKANRKQANQILTVNETLANFDKYLTKRFEKPLVIPSLQYKKSGVLNRHQHLVISDTHFGAYNDPAEGLHPWGAEEAARCMAKVVNEAANYKPQYRKETKLWVNVIGDVLQGKLHNPLDGYRLAKQKAIAFDCLVQGLAYLAQAYPEVEVNCIGGNHDRDTTIDKQRSTIAKWDNHATFIFYAVKKALSHIANLKINIPLTPWISYNSFGVKYFGTHGDTILNVGNLSGSINVNKIETQINRLNASLKDADEYKVVMIGHIHFKSLFGLSNGVTVLTNPPLLPADAYAQSIGVFESRRGQWLFESVPGHPVGDARTIDLDVSVDQDKSLEKIVKPFTGF